MEHLLQDIDNTEHILKQPDTCIMDTSVIKTHRGISQIPQNIYFDEDSDENIEYNPVNGENEDYEEQDVNEEEIYSCTSCDFESKYEQYFKRNKFTKHKGYDGQLSFQKKEI